MGQSGCRAAAETRGCGVFGPDCLVWLCYTMDCAPRRLSCAMLDEDCGGVRALEGERQRLDAPPDPPGPPTRQPYHKSPPRLRPGVAAALPRGPLLASCSAFRLGRSVVVVMRTDRLCQSLW